LLGRALLGFVLLDRALVGRTRARSTRRTRTCPRLRSSSLWGPVHASCPCELARRARHVTRAPRMAAFPTSGPAKGTLRAAGGQAADNGSAKGGQRSCDGRRAAGHG